MENLSGNKGKSGSLKRASFTAAAPSNRRNQGKPIGTWFIYYLKHSTLSLISNVQTTSNITATTTYRIKFNILNIQLFL